MMATRTLLRSNAAFNLDPSATLAKTNRMLCLNNSSCTFVTLFYFVCDLETGRISFANAGHNPPVVLRGREAGFVPAPPGRHGTALGILEEAVYLPQELSLAPGDSLILYTDGVTEAINPAQELFGEERLLEAASAAAGLPPQAVAEAIFSRLREFVGEAEQFDDITLLVFRRLPPAPGPRPELDL
jgi:sigma-B regulation protein RsbU (phosphoserine phosphatase)